MAKRSQTGQDGTEDGLRQCHLDGLFRFHSDRANATPIAVPVELKSLLGAESEQLVDESDDPALCGPKDLANQFSQW